jgi:heme/copper-type cytochrome/quinol oxidase subunit 1
MIDVRSNSLLMRFNGIGLLFSISAIVFLVASVLSIAVGNYTVDIAMHDMYFVIAGWHLYLFLSLLLILFAVIYFLFDYLKMPLYKNLGLFHFFGTVIPFIVIFMLNTTIMNQRVPRRYYSLDAYPQYDMYSDLNKFISISLVVFVAAQCLLVANIVLVLFGRKTK